MWWGARARTKLDGARGAPGYPVRMKSGREFDVVLWGASGYTGRLVAEYLATAPSARAVRWAIAGRDRERLEAVRAELGSAAPPVLVGDAADRPSLAAIASRARVVCTTVGPYARYGGDLVAACVASGTHYCDLTGEVPWIRRMIDAHHDQARERGARIVHCCGFDSIPSDLGVLMLHEAMKERGRRIARVDAFFGETRGGFSGGTIASLLGVLDEAQRDRGARRVLADPYGLDPLPRQGGPDGPDRRGVGYDDRLDRFTAPFVMSAINTRIVRRSNALTDYRYGRDFRYTERMSLPPGFRGLAGAAAVTATLGGFVAAMRVPALRRLIAPRLPAPGQGPTPEQRAAGYFVLRLLGEAEPERGGAGGPLRLLGRVEDRRDPGYGSTAVMLSESALCLAGDDLSAPGGVLTPASAIGMRLLDRLRAAGMSWTVEEMAA